MMADVATAAAAPAPAADEESIAASARLRARRRKQLVLLGQLAAFVIVVGGWELASDLKIIDPFFFGSPVGIIKRLADWAVNGTAYGSLWLQIWITVEESLLGFIFGVGAGIIFGVLLGEIPYLAEVVGPYIKIVNALPRIVLGSIFTIWLGLGLPSKVLLAAVLVFFVVFFNAFQGVRSVDRNLVANARILGASRWQVGAACRLSLGADLDHRQPPRRARLLDHRRHRRRVPRLPEGPRTGDRHGAEHL